MTLSEYIKIRQEELDVQMDKCMKQEEISVVGMSVISSAGAELERIKILIEDGKIEGI